MTTVTNGARPWTPRPRAADPARDRTISRLAVLKAASRFAAERVEIKSDDVLRIADRWLKWLEQ